MQKAIVIFIFLAAIGIVMWRIRKANAAAAEQQAAFAANPPPYDPNAAAAKDFVKAMGGKG